MPISEAPTQEGLLRAIRRWDLVALVINGIIGAGIFGLPSEIFRRIGTWSLFAFVACAAVVTLIILCFAEVSSRFSGTGGPYLYAREAFGPFVGFEVGWLLWVARLTAFAANSNLLVNYLGFLWPEAGSPVARTVIIATIVLGLMAVNLAGVRNATLVGNSITVAKLVPLLLFVTAGLFFLAPEGYALAAKPSFGEFSAAVLLLIYAFTGFEMATISAGETRDPRADLPRALLTAIAVVAALYFLVQVVAIGTLPGLADSTSPLADAGSRFLGPIGGVIISVGAVISTLGNLNVIMLVGPRLPFAMAELGQLPRWIAATHPRFHTPHVAIVITAGALLALSLSGTFTYLATISVIARLLSYGVTAAALPALRRRPGAPPALFKAPGGVAVSVAALVLVGWLLSHSTARQTRDAGIAAALGLLLYLVPRLIRKGEPA